MYKKMRINISNAQKIIIASTLVVLAVCPFLLIFKKEYEADAMVFSAYYFLIMAVVLQIIECIIHKEPHNKFENEGK